jgi:hypothetical protein
MPETLARTFTTAGARVVLCDDTPFPLSANPLTVNHPPSRVFVVPPAGGGDLVWLDLAGTSNTLTIPAGAAETPVVPFELPGTAQSIEAGTANGFQITASWHAAP